MTLSVRGLVQGYGGKEVLSGIDLEVSPGEIVSVLGPNGSGKSTLIKTICGIMKPRSGTVEVDGEALASMDPKRFSRKVGYVPQKYIPSDYMTVFESVLVGRAPYMSWSFSDDDFAHAEASMERMGIFELAEEYIQNLSGGQIQKVVMARALAQDPEYYVLDEPTSALDLRNQMVTMRTLRDAVAENGAGAVVALHDLNLAMHFSDRVVMLHDGRVHAEGVPEDTITEESIREVYGVSSEIMEGREGRFVHILEGQRFRPGTP
ncbi:MAG: ABC transporter ATP-binding protein [Candidatus Methanomethylophilaceae archaeon]|nr:ABC transporter ATP-binding protein [Candidatus Methanomethylophilaceae archaeon]